jgi:hypothetical protein
MRLSPNGQLLWKRALPLDNLVDSQRIKLFYSEGETGRLLSNSLLPQWKLDLLLH